MTGDSFSDSPGDPPALAIVGTGIRSIVQITPEARAAITAADIVYYGAADDATGQWMKANSKSSVPLGEYYVPGVDRWKIYESMVRDVLADVRHGRKVCACFYGHPAVYVTPSHVLIRQARAEGFEAVMLPGISAEDCLFADLGIDPGGAGWQSYDATPFLVYKPAFEPRAGLVLWQIEALGWTDYQARRELSNLPILVDFLSSVYGPSHRVAAYEAPRYAGLVPRTEWCELQKLPMVEGVLTLYVPPKGPMEPDDLMLQRLGLLGTLHAPSPKVSAEQNGGA